ncbi:MAG TPA: MFS transporter [Planctomycetota bacterium]
MPDTQSAIQDPQSAIEHHWWSGLTARHWAVLIMAYLGWVFDVMDVFALALVKESAMRELLGKDATPENVAVYSGYVLGLTLVGWSAGGLIFGMVADRWGRTRTMAFTILLFSVFTGLQGFAQNWWQLFLLRFVASMGIGGEWGAGAALVAEVFPVRSRYVAAGILQSAAGTGFFMATFLWWGVQSWHPGADSWRWVFWIGALPALLALIVRLGMREPDAWVAARSAARRGDGAAGGGASGSANLSEKIGSLYALFSDPELRRRTLLGTALATIGIFTYWGTTYWGPEALAEVLKSCGSTGALFTTQKTRGLLTLNAGALAGFLLFIPVTGYLGRRWAFAVFHLGSLIFVPLAFLAGRTYGSWLVLFFIAGIFSTGIYSGYTIYFPELFPTRLRATGAGFCYNVARITGAPGPVMKGWFLSVFGSGAVSGAAIASVYVLAFLVIPFLPETKDVKLDTE